MQRNFAFLTAAGDAAEFNTGRTVRKKRGGAVGDGAALSEYYNVLLYLPARLKARKVRILQHACAAGLEAWGITALAASDS